MRVPAGGVVGDDDEGTSAGSLLAQRASVVALVCEEDPAGRSEAQQVWRDSDVGDVAWTEQEGERAALTVGYGVDLCRTAAARAADCLGRSPPFPPAEAR